MAIGVGTRLGAYEITGKLGEGGMGEVWRATDLKLKREVIEAKNELRLIVNWPARRDRR